MAITGGVFAGWISPPWRPLDRGVVGIERGVKSLDHEIRGRSGAETEIEPDVCMDAPEKLSESFSGETT